MKMKSPLLETIFLASEGNAWFRRNEKAVTVKSRKQVDWPLRLLVSTGFQPKRALEIGCSSGYRLDALRQRYSCKCVGVEPGLEAIRKGKKLYPGLDLRQGVASDLPFRDGEQFDLVLVNFVLHWVSRETLLASVSGIDRLIQDGGLLILGDFMPDHATRNRYRHLPDQEVYTYKIDYAAVFEATGLYRTDAFVAYDHASLVANPSVKGGDRTFCAVMRKSLSDYYSQGNFPVPVTNP